MEITVDFTGKTSSSVIVVADSRNSAECKRVFITNVKGTFFGMSESEEASKRR